MHLLGKSADSLSDYRSSLFWLLIERSLSKKYSFDKLKNLSAVLSLSGLCSIQGDTDSTGFVPLLLPLLFWQLSHSFILINEFFFIVLLQILASMSEESWHYLKLWFSECSLNVHLAFLSSSASLTGFSEANRNFMTYTLKVWQRWRAEQPVFHRHSCFLIGFPNLNRMHTRSVNVCYK